MNPHRSGGGALGGLRGPRALTISEPQNSRFRFPLRQPGRVSTGAEQSAYPNPEIPCEYRYRGTPTELELHSARWASDPSTAQCVSEGRYGDIRPRWSEFVPTLRCCFNCDFCAYAPVKRKEASRSDGCMQMSTHAAAEYFDALADAGCRFALITGGGEPTFHPELNSIVDEGVKRGFRLRMVTNGSFKSRTTPEDVIHSGAFDRVRVSLNSIKHHKEMHGLMVNEAPRVMQNIRRLVAARDRSGVGTEIMACFVVDHRNCNELSSLAKAAVDLGVDSCIIRPVIKYFREARQAHPTIEKDVPVLDLIKEEFEPPLREAGITVYAPANRFVAGSLGKRDYDRCRASRLIGQIWPSGKSFVCTECSGKLDFCCGSLRKQRWNDIHGGEDYQRIINREASSGFKGCAVTCRAHRLNSLFHRIEQTRQEKGTEEVKKWVMALHSMFDSPEPWVEL